MAKAPTVLVTDDSRIECDYLRSTLQAEGYRVILAETGEKALEVVQKESPDLILLDVIMPGMGGLETCRILHDQDAHRSIPVIFITARSEEKDKVDGFRSGAVDYITKPFRTGELLARVATQLELKRLRDQVEDYASHLEKSVQELTGQLLHADRLSSLGILAAGIVHEINNPNAFIRGNIQVLNRFLPLIDECLRAHTRFAEEERLQVVAEELPRILESMLEGSHRIEGITSLVRRNVHKEGDGPRPCNLFKSLDDAVAMTSNRLKYNVKLERETPEEALVLADPRRITQVFINVLINAGDALGQAGGTIWMHGEIQERDVQIRIRDNGPGVPEEIRDRIFEYFFTTKDSDHGTGLGIPISRKIVKEYGGRFELNPAREEGAEFMVQLPLITENQESAQEPATRAELSSRDL